MSAIRVYREVPRRPATASRTSGVTSKLAFEPGAFDTVATDNFEPRSPPGVFHGCPLRRLFQVTSVSVHDVVIWYAATRRVESALPSLTVIVSVAEATEA